MPYQVPVLDGYTYDYAPVKNQNPKVKVVAESPTLLGRTLTDWGTNPTRQDIIQNWPVVDRCFFAVLEGKAMLGGTLAYVDDDGTAYTVLVMPPTYDSETPAGEAFLNVTMKLMVVSSP